MQFATLIALLTATGLISCSGQKKTTEAVASQQTMTAADTIPYNVTGNYFIKNDVDSVPEVIATEIEFEKCFGMATVMGNGGKPIAIDFTKQFVIVAAVHATDISTEISAVSLRDEHGTLVFTCKIAKGVKQTYTTHPFVMITVDKQYAAPVKIVWL